jgi:arsenate reductase
MSKTILYGIPNCDTTKKAMSWLNKNKVAYTFHDYKQEGITKAKLEEWSSKAGWEAVFNKRSTTWRELPVSEQNKVTNQASAIKVMMENNSIIKRPVIESGEKLVIGFNEEAMKHL